MRGLFGSSTPLAAAAAALALLTCPSASRGVEAFSNPAASHANRARRRSLPLPVLGAVSAGAETESDAKAELTSMVVSDIRGHKFDSDDDAKFDSLVAILVDRKKGFESGVVNGEWVAVYSRQGNKSPRLQKFVDVFQRVVRNRFRKKDKRVDKVKKDTSDFDVSTLTFLNSNFTPRRNGKLQATVKYNPVAERFDTTADGRIVLRRIMCDIDQASFQYRRFKKDLPLKKQGGYLDFLYLDNDVRITKGSQGGLFVHFRPAYLEKIMAD
eukprot:CAMPEP_0183302474 /NCGR_PEP_ID=MMETSP0160_2-20130417/8237_1 /TAXON_ID=2839 ORGANISM="Odontella Sinensis, Strain Grunow 1884" /NCGR_SAMPLE_ID=MMETSP0160_2 /ASSEMBLY_ACC=CAM_ASM_000250 /LENGTH=268 /DNA_ID=CAMNT_0025465245 /DNA_START=33 /DNA_END=839 /DNA_ORIENTATION=-